MMADKAAGIESAAAGEDRLERIRKLAQEASGQPYWVGGGERADRVARGGPSSAEKPDQ